MPNPGHNEQLTVLGFDHGQKRIGVAVGQTISLSASPVVILSARDGKPDWHEVKTLISRWQPNRLVVGLALAQSGTEQPSTKMATRFANQLNGRFQISVDLLDEWATSKQAEERKRELRAIGALSRSRARHDDAVAAQLIVERWLAQYAQPAEADPQDDSS